MGALERTAGEKRFWLLVAVSGTDTAEVRTAWLRRLRQWAALGDGEPDRGAWFTFLRAFTGGWLDWPGFRDCLRQGRVLSAAAPDGAYRTALDRLGLWAHPVFARWYRGVVYEVAHQPDVRLSLQAGAWITDFPGEDYLWSALDELEREPNAWWPLHVLRWVSLEGSMGESIKHRLTRHSPLVLCLASLVRSEICAAVGGTAGWPRHEQVVSWLKRAGPAEPLDLTWADGVLRPWAEVAGEPATFAAGALCSVDPPADYAGPDEGALRRRTFVTDHLIADFDRVMANLLYLHAARKQHFAIVADQAGRGQPTALRALALWPEQAEAAAPILFRLSREGSKLAREAAREALEVCRERHGISDLARLERRVDLAAAWSDAGLEGKPALAWRDVAGYHVRLSVGAGKVRVEAYSGPRRLAALPAGARADPQYAEIREARSALARTYRYFRGRLEQAMVEGQGYEGSEFTVLLANPVVRSLASRLVLALDGEVLYPCQGGAMPEWSPPQHLAAARHISIAHPTELWGRGLLAQCQQAIVEGRIAQPFKQVFREVYLLGEGERSADSCHRFNGHALVARRAFALLRERGYSPGKGDAVKVWPDGLRAHIAWAGPGEEAGKQVGRNTGAEPVTSGAVWFERGDGTRLPLDAVPAIAFSETLRDADLLASRAAAGELGFTSEETLRLRATLVRYLARALGMTSVYVSDDDTHVLVEGRRAMYRLHLGSGSVLLEKTRRHLDLGSLRSEAMEALVAESMDSATARIIGIVGFLSQDEQVTDPRFLDQL